MSLHKFARQNNYKVLLSAGIIVSLALVAAQFFSGWHTKQYSEEKGGRSAIEAEIAAKSPQFVKLFATSTYLEPVSVRPIFGVLTLASISFGTFANQSLAQVIARPRAPPL